VNYQQLLQQVKDFVTSFFKTRGDSRLAYHNLDHTQNVVSAAMQIADHYQLSDEDYFAVVSAAWFHDVGYEVEKTEHEERSVEIANTFFKDLDISADLLKNIDGCIRATKMPQQPTNLLENIICDADLFHLGTDDFSKMNKLMRKEIEALTGAAPDKNEWRTKNIKFLEQHQFHTDYARLLLNEKKQETLEKLREKQEKQLSEVVESVQLQAAVSKQPDEAKTAKKKGGKNKKAEQETYGKGVETMFRITAGNQQRLSNMADSKAHIMISVNSIVISLLLSLLLRKIDQHMNQLIPAIFLLTINLITIVFSILATRPNITLGRFTPEDIKRQNVNLLFFGNFYKMGLPEYTESMFDVMRDNDFLYKSLIRDIYGQGVVLGRKYHLLRVSYNVFMYGIVISVIAFVIASLV
jgi:predicted metal-dependent HD superfamily phosphohydrolase